MLREVLGSEGYEVLDCTEGDQAYDFIREQRPDLVLLDIGLGGTVSGWSVLELLTFDADTRQIPVLILTGTANTIEQLSIMPFFGIRVVTKPFEMDLLLTSIRTALTAPPSGQ